MRMIDRSALMDAALSNDEYEIILKRNKTYYRFKQYNNNGELSTACYSATESQLDWQRIFGKDPIQFLLKLINDADDVICATRTKVARADYIWVSDAPIGGSWARLYKEHSTNEV